MRITVLTLFPEMFAGFLETSIVGRAIERGLLEVDFVQIRDFAHDNYKHVDDTPFGGGAGMVMKCQPVLDALSSVKNEASHVIMMQASGHPYTQKKARSLAGQEHLIVLCGHYEGMDQRINSRCDDLISIGDYVLSGGELGAMVIIDSVARLLKGSIREESSEDESYENGLLEYPQYTKPAVYEGEAVPPVLLSGNHAKIREWRTAKSLLLTKEIRPDLYEKHELTKEEEKILKKIEADPDAFA